MNSNLAKKLSPSKSERVQKSGAISRGIDGTADNSGLTASKSSKSLQKEKLTKPFLKWAGGKSQLLSQLVSRLPLKYNCYFEPFLGSGALYFAVRPNKALLSDSNRELINAFKVVRDEPAALLEHLESHKHTRSYFYKLRNVDREGDYWLWTEIERASRMIYLNKTCFNGLYRVNSRGEFNVPFGAYKNPTWADGDLINSCSSALQKATLRCASFESAVKDAAKGDFVYFDPPYVPLSETSNFTAYQRNGFDLQMQERLADAVGILARRGVYVMVSNSSTETVRGLYSKFNIDSISASRSINSVGDKRGKIEELIITTY